MTAILSIFFVIAIFLCIMSTAMFLGSVISRKNVGYEPLDDVMKSQYYDFVFIKKNDDIFKEHGDDILTDKQS
ncbi:MAG: hypothetical protein ACI9CD_000068 [Candidatus Deianiraeaceae bacterium]|jgi:hypothetical protein